MPPLNSAPESQGTVWDPFSWSGRGPATLSQVAHTSGEAYLDPHPASSVPTWAASDESPNFYKFQCSLLKFWPYV